MTTVVQLNTRVGTHVNQRLGALEVNNLIRAAKDVKHRCLNGLLKQKLMNRVSASEARHSNSESEGSLTWREFEARHVLGVFEASCDDPRQTSSWENEPNLV